MKIKKISITGMHKITQKTYDINDSVTYFVGPNGAGKSTILEAIELALLGYIPGYAKTNESIMKHASGPVMAIVMELDTGAKITRTWTKSGSSVSAKVDVQGYDGQLSELVSKIELPIFNFSEFKSMTANKLKEWFISFLPNSNGEFDLVEELKQNAAKRSLPFDDVLNSASEWIDSRSETGVELVKALNAHLKEDQSYVKGQISKLQGTIESLVRYDDAVVEDEDKLREELAIKQTQESLLTAYEGKLSVRQQADQALSSLKADIEKYKSELKADCFEKDERVIKLQQEIGKLNKEIDVIQQDFDDIQSDISALIKQKASLPSANATCPYTHEVCETASALADKFRAQSEEIDKQIAFKHEEAKDCGKDKIAELQNKINELNRQLGSIESQYGTLAYLQAQAANMKCVDIGERPTDLSHSELNEQIAIIQKSLIEIEANKRYDQLASTVTQDKFKLENELEVLKDWIKLTDANGLQSTLMDKPFEDLAEDMSIYLSSMFNSPTEAKFNLVSKANSFSFGLVRSDQYIEFDYLSSGERCLFTLALIMCILDKSGSEIRTIIVDDILDHLDTDNASYLFNALKSVENIQFILAGVKECSDFSICKKVV